MHTTCHFERSEKSRSSNNEISRGNPSTPLRSAQDAARNDKLTHSIAAWGLLASASLSTASFDSATKIVAPLRMPLEMTGCHASRFTHHAIRITPQSLISNRYSQPLVNLPLALVPHNLDASHLARVRDVRAAVRLQIQADDLDGADFNNIGRE